MRACVRACVRAAGMPVHACALRACAHVRMAWHGYKPCSGRSGLAHAEHRMKSSWFAFSSRIAEWTPSRSAFVSVPRSLEMKSPACCSQYSLESAPRTKLRRTRGSSTRSTELCRACMRACIRACVRAGMCGHALMTELGQTDIGWATAASGCRMWYLVGGRDYVIFSPDQDVAKIIEPCQQPCQHAQPRVRWRELQVH